MGASDVCPEISKCLAHYLNDRNVVLEITKSLGNLSANNPNNQTKLGLNGICELLAEVLKNILPSTDLKSLLLSIKIEKSIKNNFTLKNESQDDYLFNGNLAKWVFWTIGNIIQIGKYPVFFSFLFFNFISSFFIYFVLHCF